MAHRVRHSHFLLLFEFFLLAGVENGSVISSVGVIESFRHLVPANGAGEAADAGRTAAGGKGEGEGEGGGGGVMPEGFGDLRAARPRVHLCVGLQGNWLEDLEGTGAYFHHVRERVGWGGVGLGGWGGVEWVGVEWGGVVGAGCVGWRLVLVRVLVL